MKFLSTHRRLFSAAVSAFLVLTVYLIVKDDRPQAQETPQKGALFAKFANADGITSDIRDESKELVRVTIKSPVDRAAAERFGRVVEDYGSYLVIAKDKSKAGTSAGLETIALDMSVNTPNGKFEPLADPPADTVGGGPESAVPERGYYILQLGGIAKDDWLDSLRDAGVEILQYVPHQAFFVYGEGEAIAKAAGHSRVRWIGKYSREQKLSAKVRAFSSNAADTAIYDVAIFSRAALDEVTARLAGSIGGRVLSTSKLPNNFFNVVRVQMSPAEVERVADMPEVFRIDPYVKPAAEDERAAQIVAGNYSSPTVIAWPGYNPLAQFGVDGSGVTVAVVDDGVNIPSLSGFYITSANTVDGPLRGSTSGATTGHGHVNASIIAGTSPFSVLDPLNYNYGRGIAPGANIVSIPFLQPTNSTTYAQSIEDAFATPGLNGAGATISNNSWGSGTNGNSYDSLAAQYDALVRDGTTLAPTIDPISIIFSAGNSGPGSGTLTRPKVAKNVIAVGNSENIRPDAPTSTGGVVGPSADNMDDLRNSSSRGPAADGRVKPDITAPGTVITGSRAGSDPAITVIDANHVHSSGTSHAAPQVAGAAALFTQYWRNSHDGTSPSPAMVKASIISSAQEMNGASTAAPRPNGDEGWGRINMKYMMNTGVPMQYFDQDWAFNDPGSMIAYQGRIADPSKPVRLTLVWTDPPGAVDPAPVNNLDLTVNVGGTIYKGNVFSNGNSVTGGSADTINNVENVFLPSGIPAGTIVSIAVSSVSINGDGIMGNTDLTDQNFALVAYNVTTLPVPVQSGIPFDFDGDRRSDVSIYRSFPLGQPSQWWYLRSGDATNRAFQFGEAGDKLVPADFTGDSKADIAVFRQSSGFWYVLRSEDNTFYGFPFGAGADIPVPGDYDGDNKADAAVFRPSELNWYIALSTGGSRVESFGAAGDLPVVADYDGDRKADIAVYRPNGSSGGGEWWINLSTGGSRALQFGMAADLAVPGDYTGDGKTDVAIWRPSTGFWYIVRSEDLSFYGFPYGIGPDRPVPGDYDGDGKFDAAIFRSGQWFINQSTAGNTVVGFGAPGDQAVPSSYVR